MEAGTKSGTRTVDLASTGWTRLLFALLSQRFTGSAQLEQDGEARVVVFHGGFPVHCDWQVEGTGVSEILEAAGVLDAKAASAVRDADATDSLGAWAYVVEEELVDQDTADLAMRDQCEQRISAITGLRKGELTLVSETGLDEGKAEALSAARTLRVIARSIRTLYSPDRIEAEMEHLGDSEMVVTPSYAKYAERFGLDSTDAASISVLVDYGKFRFEDLANFSGLDPVRGLQLVYTLWSCNMLKEAEALSEVSAVTDLRAQMAVATAKDDRGRSEISLVIDLLSAKLSAGAEPTEILAVGRDASLKQIDEAYQGLRKKLRADASPADSGSHRRVSEAERSLKEVRDAARARRFINARSIATKALKDRSFKRALDALNDLVAVDPDDSKSKVQLAWVQWQISKKDAEAERVLEGVLEGVLDEEDQLAEAHFYRGQLAKHRGNEREALRSFDRAAELDSKMIDALREARALRSGTTSSTQSGKVKPRKTARDFQPKKSNKARSKYWSGPWPMIWIVSGLAIAAMIAAQIVLRLDADF